MPVSITDKRDLAQLLTIVLNDTDYQSHANKINDETIRLAEQLMNDFIFCNKATTVLLTAIRCVPKSPNVYGWLLGCLPAMMEVVRMHKNELQSNMFCHVHIKTRYYSALKLSLIN